ncbi:hypothetical protein MNV49_001825 [Pseudohyphozyma bogoriensis]|nr:hypothetical protein MNV49_001825 [Pseudohyphozyma bogoriensis]
MSRPRSSSRSQPPPPGSAVSTQIQTDSSASDISDNDEAAADSASLPSYSGRPPSYATFPGDTPALIQSDSDSDTAPTPSASKRPSSAQSFTKKAAATQLPSSESSFGSSSGDSGSGSDDQPPLIKSKARRRSRDTSTISRTHLDLDLLTTRFDEIRALSMRIQALALNDFQVPSLAWQLREYLQEASTLITDIDGEIVLHYEDDQEVQHAMESGEIRMKGGDEYERKKEFDDVAKRFLRRVREIKREAKGEKEDREGQGVFHTPEGLNDWLFASKEDVMVLSKHDHNLPSRYVVLNPFTILMRITAGMQSLSTPMLLKPGDKQYVPNPTRAPKSSPKKKKREPFPDNPTPLGTRPHYRPYSWKMFGYKKKPKNDLEKGFDEIGADVDQGVRDIKAFARYGTRERWIVFITLALIPAILALIFVTADVEVSYGDSSTSTTVSPTMLSEAGSTAGNGSLAITTTSAAASSA